MINEETRRKFRELFLEEMINALDLQDKDPSYLYLSFEGRMKMLVDYVYREKYTSKVKRPLKSAHFRISNADIYDVYYTGRNTDQAQLTELATCQFVSNARNILFQGFTDSSNSFLACTIYKKVCTQGIGTRYIRIPNLLIVREDALEDKQGVLKLLLQNEWLIQIPIEDEQNFLFELIDCQYDEGSTIFYIQYQDEEKHFRLGGGILADSILDRVVHRTNRFYSGDIYMREYLVRCSL